jgi:hypothetical protein
MKKFMEDYNIASVGVHTNKNINSKLKFNLKLGGDVLKGVPRENSDTEVKQSNGVDEEQKDDSNGEAEEEPSVNENTEIPGPPDSPQKLGTPDTQISPFNSPISKCIR